MLYYIPDTVASKASDPVAAAGLDYAFGPSRATRECHRGPDGWRGLLMGQPGAEVKYDPDEQTWTRMPGGVAWFGFASAAPPGPDDLARPDMLPGHPVVLGDGHAWTVPVARALAVEGGIPSGYYCALPSTFRLNDAGTWEVGDVVAKHRRLWETACRCADALLGAEQAEGGGGVAFALDDEIDAAVVALAANYRLSRAECAALGLITSENLGAIVGALLDLPTLEAALKKKQGAAG